MKPMKLLLLALASTGLVLAASQSKTWENLTTLDSGTPVQVLTSTGAEKGEYLASSTESVTLRTPAGEKRIPRQEVKRVVNLGRSKRLRNALIGVGAGAAIGLVADQTIGTYFRNESHLDDRALIWLVPIAAFGGIGAAFPSHPVVYRK